MEQAAAEEFVRDLYRHLLCRDPGEQELLAWARAAADLNAPERMLRTFVTSREYLDRQRVRSVFPVGHYHSPVVDPASVGAYHQRSIATGPEDLLGIEIDGAAMLSFWEANVDFIRTTPFTERPTAANRFHYEGAPFPWGDAMILRAMIGARRPRRIIEIGSGFSTACMLDAADHCRLGGLRITCIEPYPDRLRSLLRPEDHDRLEIIVSPVQEVPVERFAALDVDDILFIDSTHVLKTGSDVHYELFSLLPRLRPGVLVHVHDCPFPFEYPQQWVMELNYSWNEAYALRAFLMFNNRFRVLFWNSFFASRNRARIGQEAPDYLRNPGSSIWLIVQENDQRSGHQ